MQPENSRQESDMVYFIYLFSEDPPNRFLLVRGFVFLLAAWVLLAGRAFSSCSARPSRSVAPLGVECGLQGTWASVAVAHGMRDLSRPGIKLVSPALQGTLLISGPLERPVLYSTF